MAAASRVGEIPVVSQMTLRFFQRIVRMYFRRHFRSVMVQQAERLEGLTGPLIVYANHSSWWDPMVSVLVAEMLLPGRRNYAPMDAAALKRYPILAKIGIFPVEMATARGAAQFLRTSQAILARGGVVWITPQGRFVDSRERPLGFKPGLGALVARTAGVTVIPMAIEYTFWDERLPETLLRMGEPVRIAEGETSEVAGVMLERALVETMEELKSTAMARDAGAFRVLLRGGRGTGGVYGFGRWLREVFSQGRVQVDHTVRGGSLDERDRS